MFGFAFVPPDTNGAVGDTQFVQMVNVTIAVYDKSSGALRLGPAAIHTLWTGFGGLCEFGGGTPTYSDGAEACAFDRTDVYPSVYVAGRAPSDPAGCSGRWCL